MAQYTSVLHQLLRYVPRDEFRAIVERHQGDKGVRKLSSWGQVPCARSGYRDPETRPFYVFLTNLFHLTAGEVAAIYKARWQIELFFKWVKQHLKIKSFLGTTANAVMTQLWVALCVYLLVAYVKFLRRPPGRL